MTQSTVPTTLVVDLDGTLIRSDTTHELLVLCLRWKPHLLPLAILKLLISRSSGKRWMADLVGHHIDPEHLPYEEKALDLIRAHTGNGGDVWLVSGSDDTIVQRISTHLGLFKHAMGSTPETNLTSSHKTAYLQEKLPKGFTYAGNSNQDIAVWKASRQGYGFNAPSRAYRLKATTDEKVALQEVTRRTSRFRPLRKAMRLHQWAKNILVFVVPGLMLANLNQQHYLELVAAFICFGFLASGTYLLNDLFDIPDDRQHPTKKLRQIASGNLSVPIALIAMSVMIFGSLIGAFLLNSAFGWVLFGYAITTIAYSFRLKRVPVVDVFILASLFSLRVWGGAFIVDAPPSAWLMMFIGLVFLSLALAKRFVEIRKLSTRGKVAGRGYRVDDEAMVLAFGASTANASVLALAVYGLLAPNRLIDNPAIMMAIAAIVGAWFMRIWMVAVRNELNDDPVLYAVKDKVSLACLLMAAILIASESLRPVWSQWF